LAYFFLLVYPPVIPDRETNFPGLRTSIKESAGSPKP